MNNGDEEDVDELSGRHGKIHVADIFIFYTRYHGDVFVPGN